MKKLTVVAVIVAVALTLVPAALAGGNGPGTGTGSGPKALKTTYSLNGTVKAVDTAASTLSVLVRSSNRHARAFRGDVVTISVTEATLLYRHLADCTRVPAALSDFAVGDRVTSVGGLDKTDPSTPVFTAKRVTQVPAVGACVNGHQPRVRKATYSLRGIVTAVDLEAATVSVTVASCNRYTRAYRGDDVALTVTAGTLLYQRLSDRTLVSATLADFTAGARVTSVGVLDKTDATAPVFTAKRVTLLPVVTIPES